MNAVSCVLRHDSDSRRNRGAVLAPAELATINPHPVQNHRQTPGDRDDRSTHPASLSDAHAPCLQPQPFPAMGEQRVCGFVEHRDAAGRRRTWTPRHHSRSRQTGSALASGRHARRPPGNGGNVAAGRPSHGRSALPLRRPLGRSSVAGTPRHRGPRNRLIRAAGASLAPPGWGSTLSIRVST